MRWVLCSLFIALSAYSDEWNATTWKQVDSKMDSVYGTVFDGITIIAGIDQQLANDLSKEAQSHVANVRKQLEEFIISGDWSFVSSRYIAYRNRDTEAAAKKENSHLLPLTKELAELLAEELAFALDHPKRLPPMKVVSAWLAFEITGQEQWGMRPLYSYLELLRSLSFIEGTKEADWILLRAVNQLRHTLVRSLKPATNETGQNVSESEILKMQNQAHKWLIKHPSAESN